MPVDPGTAIALLQLGRFAVDTYLQVQEGTITEEQALEKWRDATNEVAAADARWLAATRGEPTPVPE